MKPRAEGQAEQSTDEQAEPWLGGTPRSWQLHRWRYSECVESFGAQYATVSNEPPLLLAGDGFEGSHIEGAARSGKAAAEHLLDVL